MSLIACGTPRPFQPPVAQRDIKAEVIHCVGGVTSPLIFNAAMSVLDEHLHRPWKPGGIMETSSQRARGLPNWRIIRYGPADITCAEAEAGSIPGRRARKIVAEFSDVGQSRTLARARCRPGRRAG